MVNNMNNINGKSCMDCVLCICVFVLFVYILWPKTEKMDARYFNYLEENPENEQKDMSDTKFIPGKINKTKQNKSEISSTKCGNFVSSDLLPKNNKLIDDDNKFQFAPNKDVKLLIKPTQSLIGVNTQGGSLKNANLDIRSSPAIEKKEVSPWLNSTIDPDMFRRPLE